MPSPFSGSPVAQEAHEKSPLSGQRDHGGAYSRGSIPSGSEGGFSSGWSGSRLAECFASFSMCPPCTSYDSEPGYQAVSTTAPYDYGNAKPYVVDNASPLQTEANPPYGPGPVGTDQTGFLNCDDPALIAQYMQNYPPLQPGRVMGIQPTTDREGMVYPGSSLNPKYAAPQEDERSFVGPELHRTSVMVGHPNRSDPSPTGFMDDMTPSLSRPGPFAAIPPRYDVPPGYGQQEGMVKGDPDGPAVQSGADLDLTYHNQRPSNAARRGPFKDHDQREKTAQTRKIGSCIRCRMQRIRCNLDPEDEKGPCMTCKKIASSKVWRLPCLRLKITDVRLFKPGQVKGHEWTSRWQDSVVDDIGSWASTDTKTIRVTEGYTGKAVELRVREFCPQAGDKLERSWVTNGVKKSVNIPPYAIVDLEAAKSAFDGYIKDGLVECCKRLLGPREKLLWRTYALALKIMSDSATPANERKLLVKTFDLWMSIRLTTKSFEIVGDETLGMPRDLIQDHDNPLCGKIPLPPVMGAQIDSVLIHQVQAELRRETLEDLQKMTQEKKQKTWLTTYLATFILLHNIALITKHDAQYAKKHGMKGRFAREDKVKEYNLGASTLLAYFHYCNKGVFPFSEDCRDQDLASLAGLDDTTIQFVRSTRNYATDHKREWEELWRSDEYENEYYYVSQLFEQNWQPRSMD